MNAARIEDKGPSVDISEIRRDLAFYIRFFKESKLRYRVFLLPVFLGALASIFEALSLALLIPLIKGAVEQDYRLILDLPVIGRVFQHLPEEFFNGNKYAVLLLTVMTLSAAALKVACQYGGLVATKRVMRTYAKSVRVAVHARLLSFGKLFFDRANSGFLQQHVMSHVYDMVGVLETLQNALNMSCMLIVYLAIMMKISWQLTLIVLCLFPVLHFSLSGILAIIKKISQEVAEGSMRIAGQIANSISTVSLVKSYTFEEYEEQRFSKLSEELKTLENRIDVWSLLINPLQELISLFFLFLIIGVVALSVKLEGEWRIAEYSVYLIILRRCSRMFGILNYVRNALAHARGPLQYLQEVFNDQEKFFVEGGKREAPPIERSIDIRGLSFRYPDGSLALDNVCCTLKKGELTAVVGRSGSGKSTLMNLLMRFYDFPSGAIFLDEVDVREFSLKSWRSQIAIVSQDAQLFNASLRENLLYGIERKVSDSALYDVLDKACLLELVEGQAEGLETMVGDRGMLLSGGEKQRVSIARAMLKGAQILFLDEATSALDSKTERIIQKALSELLQEKTSLVIAHRLSTIQHADQVIVLERGKIVEQGSVNDLIAAEGVFFGYWREQKFD